MEDIDAILARFFAGEATPEEAIELEDWMDLSEENRQYFEDCLTIYPFLNVNRQEKGWNALATRIKAQRIGRNLRWAVGIAASLILLIAITWLLVPWKIGGSSTVIYQAQGGLRTVDLGEGSSVTLGDSARLVLDPGFGKTNRHMTLSGSATFSIRHDPALPTVIHIDQLQVEDIGTRFHITTTEDSITVRVVEGEVLLRDKSGISQQLLTGEEMTYLRSQHRLLVDTLVNSFSRATVSPARQQHAAQITSEKLTTQPPDTIVGTLILESATDSPGGKLVLRKASNRQRMEKQVLFDRPGREPQYIFREELPPGDYLWVYIDSNKAIDHGKVTIDKGKESRIRLFKTAPASP